MRLASVLGESLFVVPRDKSLPSQDDMIKKGYFDLSYLKVGGVDEDVLKGLLKERNLKLTLHGGHVDSLVRDLLRRIYDKVAKVYRVGLTTKETAARLSGSHMHTLIIEKVDVCYAPRDKSIFISLTLLPTFDMDNPGKAKLKAGHKITTDFKVAHEAQSFKLSQQGGGTFKKAMKDEDAVGLNSLLTVLPK